MKEYVVSTTGEVVNNYIIEAENDLEAIAMASDLFLDDLVECDEVHSVITDIMSVEEIAEEN